MLAKRLSSLVAGLWLACVALLGHAATVAYTPTLSQGWNLVGNSTSSALDVKTLLGTQAGSVTSVWKWNAATSKWAFYSPALDTANTLASYAATKGYDVLSSINAGDGFWVNVNATAGLVLGAQSGTGFALGASTLKTNWNLVATGDDITPAQFTTTVGNVTTLWAWNNANSGWYFYAPSAAANGSLAGYISSKNYQDFGSTTLGKGRGFWVNYAGAGTGGTGGTPITSACLLTGTATAVVGAGGLTQSTPLTANYCYALTAPFTCDARGMGDTASFIDLMFQTGFTNVTKAVVSYTPSCASNPVNMQTGTLWTTIDGNGTVDTLAGKAISVPLTLTDPLVDGAAADARFAFFGASGMVSDGTSLYVLDQGYYAIRKVDMATGATSTLVTGVAGSAMVIDATNTNLYVADGHYVRKVEIATGTVTKIAGVVSYTYYDPYYGNYGGNVTTDGHFMNATTGLEDAFTALAMATDGTSLYLLDAGKNGQNVGRILKVDLSALTLTEFGTTSAYTPSTASSSMSMLISGGHLFIANDAMVQKINLSSKVASAVAGNTAFNMRDGIGSAAAFYAIKGMASDGSNLYVTDKSAIRKIELATGIVSTIAGKETAGYADGTGAAAKFNGLGGIAMVGTYLYATDNFSTIRRIQTNGTGGTTPTPISNSTATTGPMAGTWSYSSPGGAAWSAVTDATVPNGGAVYKAAPVAQDQSTIASITVTQTGNGVVSFYKKVSSMACCDYLVFTIDGVEPTNARWSGNVAWSPANFALTAGTHTLRWSYVKGSATFVNTAGVQDTAWISQVAVTAAPPVVSGLAPASGAIASLSKILGTDLNNFAPLPTVNFNAGNTNYPASTPYALSADYSSVEFAVPQDLAAGDYSVTLGNGGTVPQTAGTFTIPVLGTQMGGARQGVALNLGSVVSTPATLAAAVSGMTTDGKNLYVAASGIIYRVAMTSGEVSVLAGGATPVITYNFGQQYCTPADGLGALASFCGSGQLTTDGTNLYFSDTLADLVRKIVIATGQVTTLPGLFRVNGITTDGTNVYAISYTNPQLIKINIATGVRTVLAGSGIGSIIDGTGTAANFKAPSGMTTDGINLYVTDGNTIRKINPASGVVTTFAGSATVAGFADGVGTAATFSAPTGITTDGTSLYLSDTQHYTGSTLTNTVRKIDIATGTVTTLPISSFSPFTTDGTNLYGTTLINGQYGIRKVQTNRAAGATAPAIVSTTVLSSTKASLSWTPVTGVTGVTTYNVYRSTSPNVALTYANKVNALTGPVAALEYTDSTLASATTYYYKVTGVITASLDTAASNEVWLRTLAAPAAPAGLSATALGASKMDLSWASVTGATSYNIYQSQSANVQIIAANAKGTATTTTTQLTGLTASAKYYYKVTAVSATGESLGSTEVSATTGAYPAVVTGLTASAASGTQIDLSWNAVAGAVSYNVYLGSDTALQGNTTQTTFAVTGLSVGRYYNNFFVRAVNAAGEQSLAAPMSVSATTLSLPNPPTGVTATAISGTQINLSWTSVTGATYNVHRSSTGYPAATVTTKITATPVAGATYSDTVGLTPGVTYYYRVTAINAIGAEQTGAVTYAMTTPPAPATPTGLTATLNGTTRINLAWSTVAGATTYNVYRSTSPGVQPTAANKLVPAGVGGAAYTNTGLPLGTTYYYVITAVNAGGESVASVEVSASTPSAPVAPTVSVSVVNSTQINLSWPAVAGATGYNVYSSQAAGTVVNSTHLISASYPPITTTQFWDAGLTAGTAYFYKVTAVNAVGESLASTEMTATTPATTVTAVVGSQMGGARQGVALTLAGNMTTLAGNGSSGAVDGIGKSASVNWQGALITDGTNIYMAEPYRVIKVVIATGQVSTLAGAAGVSGAADGVGAAASFNNISAMTISGNTLFVADEYNRKIRKIDIQTGAVSTMTLVLDAKAATYTYPSFSGITTDGVNLYVTDASYGLIRQIGIADGATTIFAGSGTSGSTNAVGVLASFYGPRGITTDGTHLYVNEMSRLIRKISISSAAVSTLAGSGASGSVDSTTGTSASFMANTTNALTSDGISLYLTDVNKIRKIDMASGAVSTLTLSDATGTLPTFNMTGLTTDGKSLFVVAKNNINAIR